MKHINADLFAVSPGEWIVILDGEQIPGKWATKAEAITAVTTIVMLEKDQAKDAVNEAKNNLRAWLWKKWRP